MVSDRHEAPRSALDLPAVLALCDRVIGEAGRRRHLFSWLRAPGAAAGDWLAVDAYYPGHRLVVLCRDEAGIQDDVYAELVPAHGLRLLELSVEELTGERHEVEAELRRLVRDLELPPRPTGPPIPPKPGERDGRPSAIARAVTSFAQTSARSAADRGPLGPSRIAASERAARHVAQASRRSDRATSLTPRVRHTPPRGTPRRRVSPRARPARPARALRPAASEYPALGVAVGLALAVIVGAEMYGGVEGLALSGGHWLLAFGILMDACARVLGAIAASRAARTEWMWWCALVGSPAVAWFALDDSEGPVTTEPAPLAGLLAMLAGAAIVLAFVWTALRG